MKALIPITIGAIALLALAAGKKERKTLTNIVPIKRTVLTRAEARDFAERAFIDVFGREPQFTELAILLAQSEYETGGWQKMYNYNWAGIKGASSYGGYRSKTREGEGASEVKIVDLFRAYPDALAGAVDWLSLLKRKYPKAIVEAESGGAKRFVEALKAGGYFTGNVDAYAKSVYNLAAKWFSQFADDSEEEPTQVSSVAKPVYASIPSGWRRAKDAEVTPAMRSLALQQLSKMTLGQIQFFDDFALACETHSNAPKGISVLVPVEAA